ncbi:MAG: dihydroneopterin aldolase [Pseudomonadota bacterium]|nr:dihydroneopterin aldolase [Pseudomonadota bacterium]
MTDMPLAKNEPVAPRATAPKILVTKVFVRGLAIEAEIGVYAHERGKRQPLIVDVELDVAAAGWRALADTVNYESIAASARAIAAAGHIGLVESFAQRLAEACFAEPRVLRARVRVEKPLALAPHAAAAGVEIVAVRDYTSPG